MNRAERLRKVAPGADDRTLELLAQLPADQVAAIAGLARQARRDALAEAAERKRQRKADDRKNANYDEEQLARRNLAVVASQGKRAESGSLDALGALSQLSGHIETIIRLAVAGCRAEGLPDADIGVALGYDDRFARQEVYRRFGKRNPDEQRRQKSYTRPGGAEQSA